MSTTIGILLYSRSKGILYMGGNAYVTGCVYQAINKKIKKKKNTKINPYGVNEPYQWPTTFYITLSIVPLNHCNDNSIVIIKFVEIIGMYDTHYKQYSACP